MFERNLRFNTSRGRGLLLAGAALLASTALAGAATVRVTVAEYSAKTGPYFEEAAKAFEAANPDTDIQIEVVPWDVLLQKLTTDISGGTNADLAIIGTRWLIDFVQQGVAEPLDGYITPEFKGRFIDTFLSPSIMDGKTYGLPIAASARAMYYNKDAAREGRHRRAAGDLGRAEGGGREDQGARRRRLRLRHAGQGDRDRRLLLLRDVVAWRRDPRRGRHVRPRQPGGARSRQALQER